MPGKVEPGFHTLSPTPTPVPITLPQLSCGFPTCDLGFPTCDLPTCDLVTINESPIQQLDTILKAPLKGRVAAALPLRGGMQVG